LGLGTGDFALWLDTTTVVAASLDESVVVIVHVVTDHVVDICWRVGGFLELGISKDNDFTYDFKSGHQFLKTMLNLKSL
jgi:hypothetical protein